MADSSRYVEDLWSSLGSAGLAFAANVDDERLTIERKRLPERRRHILTSPVYSLRNRFDMWEAMICRMERDWSPSGYYIVDEYLNDLTSRSTLARIVDSAPLETREKMEATLAALDRRFLDQTIEDRGAELGRWRSARPAEILPFLWERRPKALPWQQ